jgi:hypothetical protein
VDTSVAHTGLEYTTVTPAGAKAGAESSRPARTPATAFPTAGIDSKARSQIETSPAPEWHLQQVHGLERLRQLTATLVPAIAATVNPADIERALNPTSYEAREFTTGLCRERGFHGRAFPARNLVPYLAKYQELKQCLRQHAKSTLETSAADSMDGDCLNQGLERLKQLAVGGYRFDGGAENSAPSNAALFAQYVYALDLLHTQWKQLKDSPPLGHFLRLGLETVWGALYPKGGADFICSGRREEEHRAALQRSFSRIHSTLTTDALWLDYTAHSKDFELVRKALRGLHFEYQLSDAPALVEMAKAPGATLRKLELIKQTGFDFRLNPRGIEADPFVSLIEKQDPCYLLTRVLSIYGEIPGDLAVSVQRFYHRATPKPLVAEADMKSALEGVVPSLSDIARGSDRFYPVSRHLLFYIAHHPEDWQAALATALKRSASPLYEMIQPGGVLGEFNVAMSAVLAALSSSRSTIRDTADALRAALVPGLGEQERRAALTKFFLGRQLADCGSEYPLAVIGQKPVSALWAEHHRSKGQAPGMQSELEQLLVDPKTLPRQGETIAFGVLAASTKQRIFEELVQEVASRSSNIDLKAEADQRNRARLAVSQSLVLEDGDYLHGTSLAALAPILAGGNLCREALTLELGTAGTDGFPFHADFSRVSTQGLGSSSGRFKAYIEGTRAGGYLAEPESILLVYGRAREWQKGVEYDGHDSAHALMLAGMPSCETVAILTAASGQVLEQVKREVARNGFFIPIYTLEGSSVFSVEQYQALCQSLAGQVQISVSKELNRFAFDPQLGPFYRARADLCGDAFEGDSLRQHHARALCMLAPLTEGLSPDYLAVLIKTTGSHDVGKAVSRAGQHSATLGILERRQGQPNPPFTAAEFAIARALLAEDLIGSYLQSGEDTALAAQETARRLAEHSREAGIGLRDFFGLFKRLHSADVAAYTSAALDEAGKPGSGTFDRLFEYQQQGKLPLVEARDRYRFAPEIEGRYRALEAAVGRLV